MRKYLNSFKKTGGAVFTLLAVALAFSGASCGRGGDAAEYADTVYSPGYASNFTILGSEGSENLLIEVSDPWQGADSVTTRLLVVNDGAAPAGFDGQVLRGAARRIVTTSSTQVAMLDALGMTDRIVAVSGIDYITNPKIQAGRDTIADIGYEGAYDYEALVGVNPDLVLLYGVNSASGLEGKLRELKIPYMYVGEYVEESPLGKAEWMVPLAAVAGSLEKGEATFRAIPEKYNRIKERVRDIPADSMPLVMLNTPYNDQWFMPSVSNYSARLVSDAGARYAYEKNTGNTSVPIDMEEAYTLTSDADFWINTGMHNTLDQLRQQFPKLADTRPVVTGKVYNNNARTTPGGGNDYFESAVVHPDLVLRDLVKVFHPGLVPEDFVYYRKLE